MSFKLYNIIAIILFLFVSFSCKKNKDDVKPNKSNIAEDSANAVLDSLRFKSGQFSTINELRYENEVEGGVMAVLLFHSDVIDSIDLASAIFTLNDSSIFYKGFQKLYEPEILSTKGKICGSATEYFLWSHGIKVRVDYVLPLFNNLVSSPSFLDSCILYWGLKHKKDDYAIYAMRYHINHQSVDSLYLMDDEVATDFSGYFGNPIKVANGYSFYGTSCDWFVDNNFMIRKKQ